MIINILGIREKINMPGDAEASARIKRDQPALDDTLKSGLTAFSLTLVYVDTPFEHVLNEVVSFRKLSHNE